MAGTVTQSHAKLGNVGVITFTCTADSSDGSFPDTIVADKIEGRLLALETNPGATAPTDNYDVTIEDGGGHDVLEGVGANRDTATTEKATVVYLGTSVHPVVDDSDTLTLKIGGNSVNSAVTVIKLYYAKGA